jgi:peptidoglycan/LPS O-acetylase OafA/YrhL
MRYRPDIDGLRAVAVLSVIAFHAGLPAITAGYLGVDVFFVISGFVIGTVLMTEMEEARFSLSGFLMRRMRRLGPALIVVVASTLVASWLFLLPWEIEKLGRSMFAVFGLFANFHFMKAADYFSPDAENLPLLHMWSLSIEEQFYLVLPLLLLLAAKLRLQSHWIVAGLVALMIASFTLAEIYPYKLAATRFYGTLPRIWELLAGVVLAFGGKWIPKTRDVTSQALASLGFVMIVGSMFFFDAAMRVPGHGSVLSVLGTVLVIAFCRPAQASHLVLGHPVAVAIGAASYSAYLWHQPVLAFARIQFAPHGLTPVTLIPAFVLIAILSALSYRFIETPFRDRTRTSPRMVLVSVLVSVAVLTISAQHVVQTGGLREVYVAQLAPDQAHRLRALGDAIASRGPAGMQGDRACRFWTEALTADIEKQFAACVPQHGKSIVVLGDSHAMDLFNAMAATSGKSFVFGFARGACGPKRIGDPVCPYQSFLTFAAQHRASIERVYVTQSGNFFKAGAAVDDAAFDMLKDYLQLLGKSVPVLWLGPQYEPAIQLDRLDPMTSFDGAFAPQSSRNVTVLDAALADRAQAAGLPYFSKLSATFTNEASAFFMDGQFNYSDTDHWSTVGEQVFGARLTNALRAKQLLSSH